MITTLTNSLKSGIVMSPALLFLFQCSFGNSQGTFWFHTNFRSVCSRSVKNAGEVLIEFSFHVYMATASHLDMLTISVLPIHEEGMCFHFFMSFSIAFISVLYFSEYWSWPSSARYIPRQSIWFLMQLGMGSTPWMHFVVVVQTSVVEFVSSTCAEFLSQF